MINVAVSADRAVLDNKIGISFDFSSSVLLQGSAQRPGRGAHQWGRGVYAFPPCHFLAGRAGDGSKATTASFQAAQDGAGEESGLGGAGAEAWMWQAMKALLIKADGKQMQESESSWEVQVQFGTEQL